MIIALHTSYIGKDDLDIIWYDSKLEVEWHLGFLFMEWGGLRGVMGVMGSPRPSSGDVGGGCPMAAWE